MEWWGSIPQVIDHCCLHKLRPDFQQTFFSQKLVSVFNIASHQLLEGSQPVQKRGAPEIRLIR